MSKIEDWALEKKLSLNPMYIDYVTKNVPDYILQMVKFEPVSLNGRRGCLIGSEWHQRVSPTIKWINEACYNRKGQGFIVQYYHCGLDIGFRKTLFGKYQIFFGSAALRKHEAAVYRHSWIEPNESLNNILSVFSKDIKIRRYTSLYLEDEDYSHTRHTFLCAEISVPNTYASSVFQSITEQNNQNYLAALKFKHRVEQIHQPALNLLAIELIKNLRFYFDISTGKVEYDWKVSWDVEENGLKTYSSSCDNISFSSCGMENLPDYKYRLGLTLAIAEKIAQDLPKSITIETYTKAFAGLTGLSIVGPRRPKPELQAW